MQKAFLLSVIDARLGANEKPSDGGTYRFLLPSHLTNESQDFQEKWQRVALTENTRRALLHPGQVLLTARGSQPRAAVVTEELAGAVASSGFFILSPHAAVLPAYLVAFINHPAAQRQLREMLQRHTTVPALNKSDLERLEIPLPPLVMQRQLIGLADAWQREQALTLELLRQKEVLYQNAFTMGLV